MIQPLTARTGKILEKQDFFEDPTLPIQVCLRDPQPEFPRHSHSFDELVIVLKGTALHVVDNQKMAIRAGNAFVISRDHEHEYVDLHSLSLVNILFDSQQLGMDNWDIRTLSGFHALFSLEPAYRGRHGFTSCLHLKDRQFREVKELVANLTAETKARSPGYRIMAEGLFMQLTVYLSRAYSSIPTDESIDLLRIGDAISYIEAHYMNKITLDDLARKSHLSQRHFMRIFRDCVGRSPIEHLMHVRCQQAAQLLKRTNRNITEIAFEAGFTDSNYFSRCFRKVTGRSPRQYRDG